MLRIAKSGRKTYCLKYRYSNRQRWLTIGEHGSPWTPDTARARAKEALYQASHGDDPQAVKIETRAKSGTIKELFERYFVEQLTNLARDHHFEAEVGLSGIEIPFPYVVDALQLGNLRAEELARARSAIAERRGTEARMGAEGGVVSGIYRERIALASGRFAVVEDGRSFQLVPWRQDLDRHLGEAVTGRINGRGGVDWNFGRKRGPAL